MTDRSTKTYRLLERDGAVRHSTAPGTFGGNRRLKIYGRLECTSALRALPRGYAKHRVFFADRESAIKAGYRPCGVCLRAEYDTWKKAQAGVS